MCNKIIIAQKNKRSNKRSTVHQASEQKNEGFHAYRIAPAIIKQVMDPFLSISVIRQDEVSFARPQAGYTSFFWVCEESQGGLTIETGSLGTKTIAPGSTGALFCGGGVVCRTKPQHQSVRYLHVDIKITMEKEQLDAHWLSCVHDDSGGCIIPDHEPMFYVGLRESLPGSWNKQIQFVGSYDGSKWGAKEAKAKKQWFLQGEPLQEPLDIFSSLAMSDRVLNKLVLLKYRRGEFGQLH